METNAQPNADHTDKTVATTTTNDKSRAQANDKQTVTPATNVSNTTQPKAAPAPTALTTNAVNPKSSTAVSNPAKQAVDQSIKDAVKDKTYTNKPHDTSNSRPVSFEMKTKTVTFSSIIMQVQFLQPMFISTKIKIKQL